MSKKQIWDLVIDYKLWVALMEQYLIDNHITTKEIYLKLNQIKKQLTNLTHIPTLKIYEQIRLIDNSLQSIQQQLYITDTLHTLQTVN